MRCRRLYSSWGALVSAHTEDPPVSRTWTVSHEACRTCRAWWRWGQDRWHTGKKPPQCQFWSLKQPITRLYVGKYHCLLLYAVLLHINEMIKYHSSVLFYLKIQLGWKTCLDWFKCVCIFHINIKKYMNIHKKWRMFFFCYYYNYFF